MAGTIKGADTLAKNITKFTTGFLREVNKDMRKVETLLRGRIDKNISLSDHSLSDLAAMGHPYSRKSPQALHDPNWQVHEQSGKMRRGLTSGTEDANVSFGKLSAEAYAGINESVEHAPYVVFGTSKMIPRDFLHGSLQEVRDQAVQLLSRSLKNTVVSFAGDKVKL
jgi:hypothetical protein